jgi:hypothetical protein
MAVEKPQQSKMLKPGRYEHTTTHCPAHAQRPLLSHELDASATPSAA